MAVHTITIPDRMYGREPRTIVWDDEAGTVSGDHSKVADFRRVFAAEKPVTVGAGAGTWDLSDPAHDPVEFLIVLWIAYWPALDEPLRSTLPPVFDGLEVPAVDPGTSEILITEDMDIDDRVLHELMDAVPAAPDREAAVAAEAALQDYLARARGEVEPLA